MNSILSTFFSIILIGLTASAEPQKEQSEWVSLFNGETLEGWEEIRGKNTFRVEEGTIVGKADPGHGTTFLCPTVEFQNFELEFDVKVIDNDLNSGVQVRSIRRDGNGSLVGPQVEINAKKERSRSGYIFCQGYGRWLTPSEEMKPHSNLKQGEWNHFRVLVKNDTITTWVNGEMVTETTIPEDLSEAHSTGKIGLQVHSIPKEAGPYEVAFKNIRIKELD